MSPIAPLASLVSPVTLYIDLESTARGCWTRPTRNPLPFPNDPVNIEFLCDPDTTEYQQAQHAGDENERETQRTFHERIDPPSLAIGWDRHGAEDTPAGGGVNV
jgi:hypothetical protein